MFLPVTRPTLPQKEVIDGITYTMILEKMPAHLQVDDDFLSDYDYEIKNDIRNRNNGRRAMEQAILVQHLHNVECNYPPVGIVDPGMNRPLKWVHMDTPWHVNVYFQAFSFKDLPDTPPTRQQYEEFSNKYPDALRELESKQRASDFPSLPVNKPLLRLQNSNLSAQ